MTKRMRGVLTFSICILGIVLAWGTCLDGPPRRAREMAYRAACRSRLRSVYQGLRKYAGEHSGRYPRSLEDVVPYGTMADELECVASSRRFIYVGREAPPGRDSILAYDDSQKHKTDRGPRVRPCVIVLLNSGDVVEMPPADFKKKLSEQTSWKPPAQTSTP